MISRLKLIFDDQNTAIRDIATVKIERERTDWMFASLKFDLQPEDFS